MQKKLFSCCIIFLLALLLTVSTFALDSPFADVTSDAAYAESITYLAERGIVNGIGAGTFSPSAPLTVRQWAVMLCRAFHLEIAGETWADLSDCAMVKAYRQGWLYSSIFTGPELQICRGALYESVFTAANVSIYDHTLYGGDALSTYENILRIAAELQLCDSTADPMEIVTRSEAAQLLHATLTQELTIEAPTALVRMENLAGVNANDFLIELKKVPEPILAAFNKHGWTYCIDFDRMAQLTERWKVSCTGVTEYARKTIAVSQADATLHEFGHFLDKMPGFPAEHKRLFREEAAISPLRSYAKSNAHEYFADCFAFWISHCDSSARMECFRRSAPQTYAYFEMLAENGWHF